VEKGFDDGNFASRLSQGSQFTEEDETLQATPRMMTEYDSKLMRIVSTMRRRSIHGNLVHLSDFVLAESRSDDDEEDDWEEKEGVRLGWDGWPSVMGGAGEEEEDESEDQSEEGENSENSDDDEEEDEEDEEDSEHFYDSEDGEFSDESED
jgi:hypothetical protein